MMRSNHLIFIGGIHGVGKTTTCKRLANALGAVHLQAGKLISKHLEKQPKTKIVKNVDKNQGYLLFELEALSDLKKPLILDGHFTLLNNNTIRKIPKKIFLKMKPSLVIVLTDAPARIAARLKKRDKLFYDIALLRKMQALEREHARSVADTLRVDYLEFSIAATNKLTTLIKRIVRSQLSFQTKRRLPIA